MSEKSLQDFYTDLIGEAVSRLAAGEEFLAMFAKHKGMHYLDSAALQVRKALESIALGAIAPDKEEYAALRASANKDPDFTKDYHAAKIFAALERVNPNFYPKPLLPAERQADGKWHFAEKKAGFLSKKQFERAYDRLGKHLHANNPWGSNKNSQNLASDLPSIIRNARGLLQLHVRFIQTAAFHGAWIVEAATRTPRVITGSATGPYIVK